MGSLPKPLIGLLLGTIAFFALWMVALKPSSSSSSSSGSQSSASGLQSAINKAHQAVTTSNQANAKLGAPTATTTAPAKTATSAAPATKAAPVTKAAPASKPKTATTAAKPQTKAAPVSTAAQVKTVDDAIRNHKVLAALFYNPAAADDKSMVKELSQVSTKGMPLVKVAVPVSQLTQFAAITTKVPVAMSPTLVIIDPKGRATTIAGWASLVEISTRIADAASAK